MLECGGTLNPKGFQEYESHRWHPKARSFEQPHVPLSKCVGQAVGPLGIVDPDQDAEDDRGVVETITLPAGFEILQRVATIAAV